MTRGVPSPGRSTGETPSPLANTAKCGSSKAPPRSLRHLPLNGLPWIALLRRLRAMRARERPVCCSAQVVATLAIRPLPGACTLPAYLPSASVTPPPFAAHVLCRPVLAAFKLEVRLWADALVSSSTPRRPFPVLYRCCHKSVCVAAPFLWLLRRRSLRPLRRRPRLPVLFELSRRTLLRPFLLLGRCQPTCQPARPTARSAAAPHRARERPNRS